MIFDEIWLHKGSVNNRIIFYVCILPVLIGFINSDINALSAAFNDGLFSLYIYFHWNSEQLIYIKYSVHLFACFICLSRYDCIHIQTAWLYAEL